MKNTTQRFLVTVLLSTVLAFAAKAQTSVSGGIYSNTTWTSAGSPYIVTDTIVVFPGVTLTIQPGVTVKFNSHVQLELRQAAMIAWGTNAAPITFTSNSALTPGSWDKIYVNGGTMNSKFNYCNFTYATNGICDNSAGDSLIIKNSNFSYNSAGLYNPGTINGIIDSCNFTHNGAGAATLTGSIVTHCNFSYNTTGLGGVQFCTINNCTINNNTTGFSGEKDNTITNCIANYNQTGIFCGRDCIMSNCKTIHNQTGILTGNTIHDDNAQIKNTISDSNSVVGIEIGNRVDSIVNCEIKYNTVGFIDDNADWAWPNIITKNDIENNSTGIKLTYYTYDAIFCNKICNNGTYDLMYAGTNNITVANNYWCTPDSASTTAVIYDGYDNISYGLVAFMPIDSVCYLTSGVTTGIATYEGQPSFSFNIFPNPATDHLTVELPATLAKTEIKIFNMLGDIEYSSAITDQKTDVDISSFAKGIYFIQLTTGNNNISRKIFIKQ